MQTRVAVMLLGAAASAACGGGSAERRPGEEHAGRAEEPVELALRAADGRFVDVGDLRGRPTLLWVFATFDGVCQAAIRPLSRFARAHPEVHVVGVAAQPNAQLLLDAYQSALQPPFVLTYDAEERVTEGTSDLGDVDTVPTYVMLDAEGMEVARHTGFAGENRLERLLATATRGRRQRGGDRPPPLLGPERVSEDRPNEGRRE